MHKTGNNFLGHRVLSPVQPLIHVTATKHLRKTRPELLQNVGATNVLPLGDVMTLLAHTYAYACHPKA